MAEDTLTLKEDDGTTTHSFTRRKVDAQGSTLWDNPGSGTNLAEVRTLVRAQRKTKAGILNRSALLTIPVYTAATGKYDRSIQVRTTLNAPESVTLEEQEDALSMQRTLFDPAVNADFVANFVRMR